MATLTGQSIASSYEQLLSLPDGGGNTSSLVAVTDGDGGTTFCISLTDASTGKAVLAVDGSHASGTEIQIDNSAGDGDSFLSFQLSGTSVFTMGVDDGDSDKFKIGTTAIGTDTMFELSDNSVTLGNANVTAVYMSSDSQALVHSAGIQFAGNQVANAGANVLDDYEEADFEPSLGPADGNNQHTLDYDSLHYVKIGQLVHVQGFINMTAANINASGSLTMSLPFTAKNATDLGGRSVGSVIFTEAETNTSSGVGIHAMVEDNGARITFEAEVVDSGRHPLDDADLQAGTGFVIGLTYIASA